MSVVASGLLASINGDNQITLNLDCLVIIVKRSRLPLVTCFGNVNLEDQIPRLSLNLTHSRLHRLWSIDGQMITIQ